MKERKVLGEGNFLRLVREDQWEFVERVNARGVVILIPLTKQNEIILVEQYRPAVKHNMIELPAGLAGDRPDQLSEAFIEAAGRELHEETGYEAGKIEELFFGSGSPGMSSGLLHYYLCTELKKTAQGGGVPGEEDITVHPVALSEVENFIKLKKNEGKLIDTKIYAGLYFAYRHFGLLQV